jgi:hypothetical protein
VSREQSAKMHVFGYKSLRWLGLFLCLSGLSLCTNTDEIGKQIAGTYKFKHKNGVIEIWKIGSDLKFEELFCGGNQEYLDGKTMLTCHGEWFLKSNDARPVLSFSECYTLIDYGNWKTLEKPQRVTGVTAGWVKGKGTPDSVDYLDIFEDVGYLVPRIK